MISIVLYGRNDSYGYNLHKRAALGLNCMAEILTDPDDEILFVDYNTPDDHPTFPEAIADTLTANAAARLRILRVRPAIHDRYRSRTHLKALEPVARNVAVRRSNPRNRWILSTNTDMIFVPRTGRSLSEIVRALPAGYYHIPRFELPESLWEGFDRRDPATVIEQVGRLGRTMFLNEIVYGEECIKYDAPGDFQLIARDDLFRIHGFNEEMLLGWHVDSNIAKRLHLMYGVVGDLVGDIFGYHCDHTRQVTPMHGHNAASNSSRTFVEDVTVSELPQQADAWGCAGDEIEELRLSASASHVYRRSLGEILKGEWTEPVEAWYIVPTFNKTSYDSQHVLPFLVDLFITAPRRWSVGWVGGREDTFRLFCAALRRLGFHGDVLLDAVTAPLLPSSASPGVRVVARREIDAHADTIVVDFGAPSESPGLASRLPVHPERLDEAATSLVRESFLWLVNAERARVRGGAEPRRIVCVAAVHNKYERMVKEEITAASTPFAARLRHGFVVPETLPDVWRRTLSRDILHEMRLGTSGTRGPRGIVARPGEWGYLFTGPDLLLPPGDYRLEVTFRPRSARTVAALVRPIVLEIVAGSDLLRQVRIRRLFGTIDMPFSISRACYERRGLTEVRLLRGRSVSFSVTRMTVTQVSSDVWPVSGETDGQSLFGMLGLHRPGESTPQAPDVPAPLNVTATGRA